MREPIGSPSCWRVRSALSEPAQPLLKVGPVTSDRVWSMRSDSCFGARFTVLP